MRRSCRRLATRRPAVISVEFDPVGRVGNFPDTGVLFFPTVGKNRLWGILTPSFGPGRDNVIQSEGRMAEQK
jgi:hypothetical protein